MTKEVYIVVPFESLEEDDFIAPSAFYFRPASGEAIFVKCKDRAKAQQLCDEWTEEKGKYTIRAIKNVKTKSKTESGDLTCYGSNTRRGFAPRLKGLK